MAEGPAIEFVTTDETYLKDLVERSFLMMIEEKEEEKEKKKEKQTEEQKEKKKYDYQFISVEKTDGTSETDPTDPSKPGQSTKIDKGLVPVIFPLKSATSEGIAPQLIGLRAFLNS